MNKEYSISVPDGMETTVLLSDEDAKARGLKASDKAPAAEKAKTPANKQHPAPQNKAADKAADA